MKELRTRKMKTLLAAGLRKAKRHPAPGDGGMFGLIHETLANRWHYQVEYIHDTRFDPKPYVIVYAFPPKHRGVAEYYLR